jgi:ketosteroid isomerase-like protein
MTKNGFMILLVAFVNLNAPVVSAQAKVDEKTLAFLKQFTSDYSKSTLDKKPEMLAVYYREDVRLMPPFQRTIMGKENLVSYSKAFTDRFDIQDYNRAEMEALDLGSMVSEIGMFTMKMKAKSTGKAYDLKGKYLNLWGKENGKLSLIAEAWNYDHAIDFADQLKFKDIPNVDVALSSHVNINNNISFELAALNRLMEATISQQDAKIWCQFYSDDAIFCHSGHTISKGKKEVDNFLIEHCNELPIFEKLDIRNDRIDHLGTYVIEYASHIATVRNGDWSGVGVGKDLRIWRREKDGSLKIFRHIGSYD